MLLLLLLLLFLLLLLLRSQPHQLQRLRIYTIARHDCTFSASMPRNPRGTQNLPLLLLLRRSPQQLLLLCSVHMCVTIAHSMHRCLATLGDNKSSVSLWRTGAAANVTARANSLT